jgi:hypothetical protein
VNVETRSGLRDGIDLSRLRVRRFTLTAMVSEVAPGIAPPARRALATRSAAGFHVRRGAAPDGTGRPLEGARMRLWTTWLLVAGLAFPALARGQGAARLSIGAVQGENRRAVTGPLSAALCAGRECIPRSEVTRRGKVDFARMERREVAGLIFGSVTTRGGRARVWLALVTRSMTPARTWTFDLDAKGRLAPEAIQVVARDVDETVGRPTPRADPLAFPPLTTEGPRASEAPPQPPAAGPAVAPAAPPSRGAVPEAGATGREPGAPAPAEATAPREPAPPPLPLVVAELGAFLTSRNLTYQGVPSGASPLVGFRADVVAGPWARVEVYPFAPGGEGLAAGLAPYLEAGASIGLTTSTAGAGGTTDLQAQLLQLQAGVLWRLPIGGSRRAAVVPGVAYQLLSFTFDPTYPGLPNSSLQGIRLCLGLEVPLGDVLGLQAQLAWVPWLSARDLVGSPAFFPASGAYGLEAELGLSFAIAEPVSLRLAGTYALTRYALEAAPASSMQATGAKDEYFGGRGTVRVAF